MGVVPETMKTDVNRRQSVGLVRRATERVRKAQSQQLSTIRFAYAVGVSLRDIAEAAGVSHTTVKNMLASVGDDAGDEA